MKQKNKFIKVANLTPDEVHDLVFKRGSAINSKIENFAEIISKTTNDDRYHCRNEYYLESLSYLDQMYSELKTVLEQAYEYLVETGGILK